MVRLRRPRRPLHTARQVLAALLAATALVLATPGREDDGLLLVAVDADTAARLAAAATTATLTLSLPPRSAGGAGPAATGVGG